MENKIITIVKSKKHILEDLIANQLSKEFSENRCVRHIYLNFFKGEIPKLTILLHMKSPTKEIHKIMGKIYSTIYPTFEKYNKNHYKIYFRLINEHDEILDF
ncbi:MAG: hypothetical protein KKG60_03695 [Nanoarchaeota archaeon]|nr:hypothetical protein [Nanoarchaeota archaeon]